MGKVKAWLMDMEAEAVGMTKKEFIKQYGLNELGVWEKANAIDSGEPDISDLEPSQEEIDKLCEAVDNIFGPASNKMIFAAFVSMVVNSFVNTFFDNSAIAPAISIPVGPPPIRTNFISLSSSFLLFTLSAFSKAFNIFARIEMAFSIFFKPGEKFFH